nr:MAG TPA: hypothetical protein [Caudoviricetes sp.]
MTNKVNFFFLFFDNLTKRLLKLTITPRHA